jgi:diguanylate cyclase (GGDEF)-like protein/PAS domain S-box-containing protein
MPQEPSGPVDDTDMSRADARNDHLRARAPAAELQAIVDQLPAMVAYWNVDLRNRQANRAYIEWFGIAPEDMYDMHISELLGPEVFTKNLPYIEGALDGRPQLFNRTLIDAAGRERVTQASYIPDVVDGEVRGFVVLVTDISSRVEVERELERRAELYRALARDTPNGFVLVFDRDLRFLVADGSALTAFGYTRRDLEGRTIFEAAPARLAAELERRYAAALAGETVTWERRRGPRTFSLTVGPLRDRGGEVFAGMVSGTDVTVLRQSEAMNMALGQIATAVARQASPAAVFAQVAESVRDLFDVEAALIARFDAMGAVSVLASAPRHPPDVPTQLAFVDGDERHSALAAVQRTARAALVRYADADLELPAQLRAAGFATGAGAPVRVRDRLWGALVIGASDTDRLDGGVLDQLSSFAELVALAVGNAEAWDALARDARTDALTGLANHRTFQERLRQEIAHAGRHGHPLSLVLFDIDHFKSVNDTHGHQTGDAVLAELARRLKPLVRGRELLARTGGEEFGWILPDTEAAAAVQAAERLRATVGRAPFAVAGTVTVSAGVAVPGPEGDATALLAAADRALYEAKRQGRNRTCREH